MQYRKKPVVVEAVQFLESHAHAHLFDDQPLPLGVRCTDSYFHKENRKLWHATFRSRGKRGDVGPVVEFGDFVVTDENGDVTVMDAAKFAATYEPALALADEAVSGG